MTFVNKQNNAKGHQTKSALTSAQTKTFIIVYWLNKDSFIHSIS